MNERGIVEKGIFGRSESEIETFGNVVVRCVNNRVMWLKDRKKVRSKILMNASFLSLKNAETPCRLAVWQIRARVISGKRSNRSAEIAKGKTDVGSVVWCVDQLIFSLEVANSRRARSMPSYV